MERKHKLRSILAFMLTFAMILGGLPSSFVSTVYANNSLTFSRTEKVDGMKVTVEADESVFPEGAALSVEKVGREEQEKAEETIESQRESGQMVAASYTYDVKMLDADGNEIQPEDGKRFKISFTLDEIADENLETNVYHIKESGSDVSVTTGSAITDETGEVTVEKLEVETDSDTATAETDGFSLYTVEFTYNDLQYILPGDSEVELSQILSTVGLSGEVTEVSVSDSSLFSAAKNDSGEWIVTAHKAFSTDEWMKVTIHDVVYEITVTDDQKIPIAYYCDGNKMLYLLMDTQSNYDSATTYKGQIITQKTSNDNVTRKGMEDQPPEWYTSAEHIEHGEVYFTDNDVIEHVVIESSFANATIYSFRSYFNSKNLRDISGLEYLNTSNAVSMEYMFSGCKYLTTLDLRTFNTSSVRNMHGMFMDCTNLEHIYYTESKFITTNVSSWDSMFQDCYKLPGYDSAKVNGNNYTKYMEDPDGFKYYVAWCEGNKTIYFFGQYGELNAGDTYKDQVITSVYSGQDVIEGKALWKNNGSVQYVVFEPSFAYARPRDISSWFEGFGSLISISGLEYLDTSQVQYMQSVFKNCYKLTTIDLSHFNTSNVINMRLMFQGCNSMETLDLSSFNTSKVQLMNDMFYNCSSLKTIIVGSGWNTNKVSNSNSMFGKCNNLVGCEGTVYASDHQDKAYAHVDRGPNNPGYLSDGKIPATAPSISTQPEDTSIAYGATGNISISAAAATDTEYNLSYQWYSNDSNSNEGGTKINGATAATYALPNDKAVGDYYYFCEVTATRKDNSKKKSVRSSAATVTVTQKAVTVKANDQTVELNGTISTGSGQATLTGAVDGHTLDSVTLTAGSTANVTTSGTITPSGATIKNGDTDVTANYAITYANGVLTVTRVVPSVTAPTAIESLIYNGDAQTLITAGSTTGGTLKYVVTASSATEAPVSGWSTTVPSETNAGDYKVWYKVEGNADYNDVAAASVSATIGRKSVTVSGITASNKTYDGTTTATLNCSNAEFSGKENGDTLTVTASGTFADANVGENKDVTISNLVLGGASAGNYVLAENGQQSSATATISKKKITITGVTAKDKEYDGNTDATIVTTTATINGKVGTDDITFTVTGTFANADKGSNKTVNLSGWALTAGGNNYEIDATNSQKTTTAKITGIQVYISGLNANDKVYDGTTSVELGGTAVLKKVNGDTEVQDLNVSGITAKFSGTSATGNNTMAVSITGGTLSDPDNYELNLKETNNKLHLAAKISPKPVTITGLSAENKAYDGNTTATVTGIPVMNGRIGNDDVTVSAGTAAFEDANVGEGKTVTFSGFTLEGTAKNNYSLTEQPANVTADITKANSSCTAPTAKSDLVYDGSALALIEAGSATGGTIKYSKEKNGTYSEEIPTGVNAGTYKVWYFVDGDGNHNNTDKQSVSVSIAQATPDIGTVTADDLNDSTEASSVELHRSVETVPGALELTSTSLKYGTNENCSWKFTPTDTTNYKAITGTVTVNVRDTIVPTGEVSIKENKWSSFLNAITFGWYQLKDKVKITSADSGSGVDKVYYFIHKSETPLTEAEVTAKTEGWTEYGSPFSIPQDMKCIIYVKIVDKAGNTTYISSDGLGFDGTAPAISGATDGASYVYGTPIALSITDGGELASVKINDVTENASGTYTKSISDAGSYTVTATDKAGNTSAISFSITKAPITVGVTIDGWIYGESAKTPEVTGNTGNGIVTYEYKLQSAAVTAYTTAVPTDAGAYTLRATVAATANYQGGSATANFTISKAAITPTVSISGWTYGGTASTPTVTGNNGNGTVTYEYKKQSEADTAYASAVPTNAGDYTIRATIAESTNYQVGSATVNFTIAKGTDPAIVTTTAMLQRGGKTLDLSKLVSGAEGTVSFAFKDESSKGGCSLVGNTLTSGADVGTAVIKVTIADSDNCNGRNTDEITVSIVDKEIKSLTVTQADVTYGGTAVNPSYTVESGATHKSVTYTGTLRKDGSAYSSSTAPTEAGSYSVTVFYETDTAIYSGSTTFTIKPLDIKNATVTLDDSALTYTGSAQTKSVSSVVIDSKTIAEGDYSVTGNIGTNAGSYTVTVTAKDTSNYTGTATKGFTIAKVSLSVTADAKTKKYGETDPALTFSATGFVNSETADGLKTGSLTRDAGENVGEYAIKAGTLSYGGNYSISFTGAKLTITQADGDTTKPGKPELKSKTDTTITVNAVGGFEYQITPGGEWQNSGEFTGLTAGTEYSIITRKAETANVRAGAQSDALSVKTNAAAGQITEVIGKIGTGEIDVENVLEENVPQSTVSGMTAEFADSILTNEEKTAVSGGQKLTVTLDIKNIDSTVPADDKTKSETKAKEVGGSNAKVGLYLDISLFKQIGNGMASPVHETGGKKVHMVLSVPEGLRNRNTGIVRTFFIIRIHGDTAAKIAESTGTEIPFDSDLFSTYSLAYSDKSSGSGSDGSGGGSYSPGKTTPARPAAPALDSKTDASITVKTVAGQVYSIDGGKNWQASGTFTGLSPETEYSIVTKVSETSTSYESAVSDALKVKTDKKADASTPTAGPGSTTTPTDKPDDTAAPGSTTSPTVQPGDTATPGGTEAPGSTETPDADKKPAAEGTVLVDAGKTAACVVTSADAKHPTIAYKKCRNKKAKTVTIPKTVKIGGVTYTVTSIAANAFKNHKTLTKVTIGDSIKTIGKNAFYGCKKLKTVTIGKNVTTIGAGAFSGCKKLVAVKMGSKVSVIGAKAFYNCASLKSITLPKTVKKIGKKAFSGCGKLKKITVKAKKLTLKNVGKNAFSGIYIRASVLVPGDKRKEYALLFRKRGAGKKIRIKTK